MALANRNLKNGYFIYDIEFTEPDPTAPKNGRPDMLALRFVDGAAKALVFVELKSNYDTCTDSKTGVTPHLQNMKDYLSRKDLVENRRLEAERVIDTLITLGIAEGADTPTTLSEKLQLEILFIFTREAMKYESKPVEPYESEEKPVVTSVCATELDSGKLSH